MKLPWQQWFHHCLDNSDLTIALTTVISPYCLDNSDLTIALTTVISPLPCQQSSHHCLDNNDFTIGTGTSDRVDLYNLVLKYLYIEVLHCHWEDTLCQAVSTVILTIWQETSKLNGIYLSINFSFSFKLVLVQVYEHYRPERHPHLHYWLWTLPQPQLHWENGKQSQVSV